MKIVDTENKTHMLGFYFELCCCVPYSNIVYCCIRSLLYPLHIWICQKAFWLMGKIWSFVQIEQNEYERSFYWQQHFEILFCFHFMKVYKFCWISNIDQTNTSFAMYFSYFVEEIMNTKICKIYRKNCPLTAIF